jgi:hypothetical protein
MPFYVVRDQINGTYLSMLEDKWVTDIREAAVFSRRSTALHTIRTAWRDRCFVERIERLPDRNRLSRGSSRFTMPLVPRVGNREAG